MKTDELMVKYREACARADATAGEVKELREKLRSLEARWKEEGRDAWAAGEALLRHVAGDETPSEAREA